MDRERDQSVRTLRTMSHPASKAGILEALRERIPGVKFGLREPFNETKPILPETLWDRVKVIFSGIPVSPRLGEVELCILHKGKLSDSKRAEVDIVLEECRPAGVVFKVLEFEE